MSKIKNALNEVNKHFGFLFYATLFHLYLSLKETNMRNSIKFSLTLIFTMLVFACSEKEPEIADSKQIKFGTVCGWCAGEEFILVSPSKVEYHRNIPCGDNKGNTTKSIDYCSCEWDVLLFFG